MTTYEDLTPLSYFGEAWAGVLVAVGWLGRARTYRRGDIDPALVDTLVAHLRDPWQPAAFAGVHTCELCRVNQAPPSLHYNGERIDMGGQNLFIPGDGSIYCAPSMILHYLDAHDYCPPEAFQQALLDCPPQKTMAYKKLLLQNGGRQLLPSRRII